MSYNLDAIRMLMGERNSHVRNLYRSGLFRSGLRGIEDCSTSARALEILVDRIFDLIVLDADMQDPDSTGIIRLLRERKVGKDPFASVILIADPPNSDRARKLINAGADAILIRPISVEILQKKIVQLIETRHPFVVTHEYIGPERRTEPRDGTKLIHSHPVPNNLRNRAMGKIDDNLHFKAVEESWIIIKKERIARIIYQISWLANHIIPLIEKNDAEAAKARCIQQFCVVIRSIDDWTHDTKNDDFFSVYKQLKEKAQSLAQAQEEAQLELIKSMRSDAAKLDVLWRKHFMAEGER
jgi:DNA-binding response OmpR family regulator